VTTGGAGSVVVVVARGAGGRDVAVVTGG